MFVFRWLLKKQILFSPYLLFVIKVASYSIIVMYVTFLTILYHLDMGLFDSQNAKEMCFFIGLSLANSIIRCSG